MNSIPSPSDSSGSQAATKLSAARQVVSEWLHLHNLDVVDLTLATVLANKASGDPVWILLVAPPSSAKTEIIRGLHHCPAVYPMSAVTAHTFASGWEDKEDKEGKPSLLDHLKEGTTLAVKDLGSLLSLRAETKAEVFQQLREIYDGQYRKQFGTGKKVEWEGRVGLIAGATLEIEIENLGALGERFLRYRLFSTDEEAVALQAIADEGQEDQMRHEIAAAFFQVLSLDHDLAHVAYAEGDQKAVSAIAMVLVVLRTPVPRDRYIKNVLYQPVPEGPARVAKALWKLTRAVAAIRGHQEIQAEDLAMARRIALDSVPSLRASVIPLLMEDQGWVTTKDVAAKLKLPVGTARHALEDLHILEVLERQSAAAANAPDNWRLTEGWVTRLTAAGLWVKHQ